MPFIDPETHQFISPAEMAQRELRAADASLAAIRAGLEERLAFEDVIALRAEYLAAQQAVIRARAAVAEVQSAAEQKTALAKVKEERARLRNLRARLGEYSSATRDLRKALGEVERHYSRATDTIGAISAALPNDVCLPPGYWTWTELEIVENAAAVEAVVREQIAIAAAALRANGDTEETNTEDTGSVPLTDAGAVTDANNDDVIGDTSTSTSTGEE